MIGSMIEPTAGQEGGKALGARRSRPGLPSVSLLMEKSLFPGRAPRLETPTSSPLWHMLTNRSVCLYQKASESLYLRCAIVAYGKGWSRSRSDRRVRRGRHSSK